MRIIAFALLAVISGARLQAQEPTKPPLIVAVAIDEAGITAGELERSQDLIRGLLETLSPGARLVLASFSGEKRIILPPTADQVAITAALNSFTPGAPGVALPDGLFDIVDYLGSREAEARAIVLFSTGRLRDGDLLFEDPLNAANSKGIRILAIGLGQGDGKILRRVAKLTGGEYIRLEVADAAMLTSNLSEPSHEPSAADAATTVEASTPEASATPKAAGGLLGAAAIFFSLGGLLMLGIVILLVRKLSAHPPAPNVSGASSESIPVPLESKAPPSAASVERDLEDDPTQEKTLVINVEPTLRALSGPGAGKNFPLSASSTTSIGRSRSNDVVVPEDAASAQHCRIDREGDSYVIHNMGATNGTWVNGAKVDRAVLRHADRLKIGETVFVVSLFGDRA
ncbi:MAG: FHA domain-containing protein [Vicinamibacteria bacterium]